MVDIGRRVVGFGPDQGGAAGSGGGEEGAGDEGAQAGEGRGQVGLSTDTGKGSR